MTITTPTREQDGTDTATTPEPATLSGLDGETSVGGEVPRQQYATLDEIMRATRGPDARFLRRVLIRTDAEFAQLERLLTNPDTLRVFQEAGSIVVSTEQPEMRERVLALFHVVREQSQTRTRVHELIGDASQYQWRNEAEREWMLRNSQRSETPEQTAARLDRNIDMIDASAQAGRAVTVEFGRDALEPEHVLRVLRLAATHGGNLRVSAPAATTIFRMLMDTPAGQPRVVVPNRATAQHMLVSLNLARMPAGRTVRMLDPVACMAIIDTFTVERPQAATAPVADVVTTPAPAIADATPSPATTVTSLPDPEPAPTPVVAATVTTSSASVVPPAQEPPAPEALPANAVVITGFSFVELQDKLDAGETVTVIVAPDKRTKAIGAQLIMMKAKELDRKANGQLDLPADLVDWIIATFEETPMTGKVARHYRPDAYRKPKAGEAKDDEVNLGQQKAPRASNPATSQPAVTDGYVVVGGEVERVAPETRAPVVMPAKDAWKNPPKKDKPARRWGATIRGWFGYNS